MDISGIFFPREPSMTPSSTAFPGNLLPCGLILTWIFLVLYAPSAPADLVAHYSFDENVPDDPTVVDSLGRNNGIFINSSNVSSIDLFS